MERTGQRAEAAAMIEATLRRPGAGEAQIARLLGLRAVTLAMLRRLDESEQAADEALARAEAVGDRFAAGYALHARTTACLLRPDQAGMVRYADLALAAIGDDPRTADLRVMLLANKAGPLAKLGHHREALATVQQALALAERTGVTRTGRIRVSLAFRQHSMGQWDDALAELEQVVGLPGPDNFHLEVHGLLALIAGHKDERETASGHLAALAKVRTRDAGLRALSVSLLAAQALAAEQAGQPDAAVTLLAACLDPRVAADIPDLFELLPLLTRLALTVGDTAAAAAASGAAATAAEREPLAVKSAVADHCRGLLAADPALLFAAVSYYQSAERPLDQGQALEDVAVLLASGGEARAARAQFTEAVTIYDGLGAAWDVRRASERLGALGIRRGTPRTGRPATGWAALTRTELKVAQLVAVGASNPDIAAELFLSRNTVQTHVSHILAKLGAQSRAAIVRESLQHPAAHA
jgi:DNA-binding CsgD family transcriptional regulator